VGGGVKTPRRKSGTWAAVKNLILQFQMHGYDYVNANGMERPPGFVSPPPISASTDDDPAAEHHHECSSSTSYTLTSLDKKTCTSTMSSKKTWKYM
jgi:hypothetical protein